MESSTRPPSPPPGRAAPAAPTSSAGFTLAEALVGLTLALIVTAAFLTLFRQGGDTLRLQPELAWMRHDAGHALDRIAADLARAGSGLPPEIPVFNDLGAAGDHDPDGLDFLAAPADAPEVGFEPVTAFDGAEATLSVSDSRLDPEAEPWVVVFNDDMFMPRWVFGQVSAATSGSGGIVGEAVGSFPGTSAEGASGARVRIAPLDTPWHHRFHAGDGGSFEPGQGGLMGSALQALLGGVVDSVFPGADSGMLAGLTEELVEAVVDTVRAKKGKGTPGEADDAGDEADEDDGYGLFGLSQPGVTPVNRIRYWLREPDPDGRRVLLRQVDTAPPQPVGFLDDLQVRYFTGDSVQNARTDPPAYVGDMASASTLSAHVVRAVEVTVRVRSTPGRFQAFAGEGGSADSLSRSFTRRVGLRVAAAGADRRLWEESMQRQAVLTDVPRIGPLRYLDAILGVLQ